MAAMEFDVKVRGIGPVAAAFWRFSEGLALLCEHKHEEAAAVFREAQEMLAKVQAPTPPGPTDIVVHFEGAEAYRELGRVVDDALARMPRTTPVA